MLDILPTVQENEKEVLLKGNICFSDILENDPQTPDDIPYMQVGSIPIHAVVRNTGTLLTVGPELRSHKETVTNPGLRKIPVVGRHLSNVSIVDERYRLLILIKPTVIVQDEVEADAIGALAPISRDRDGGGAGGMGGGAGGMGGSGGN
jgi:type II secretory pathway component GspD/PulD (secretin)